ncbi:MAG: hypothetical protein JW840_10050 [Candidatus Thermoplasmatota archaeon]|nr:hypothetical protein [Candidatus Thermoplasmatota archaeon]
MSLYRLESEKSQEIARSLHFNELQQLLSSFEADVSTALNIAGIKGLKEIGKKPVIISTLGDAEGINQCRLKEIIRNELTVYLTSHYLDNMFSNGRFSINVILQEENPIPSIENITLEVVPMQLKRYTLPFIGPVGSLNHSTYLIASLLLNIEIRSVHNTSWDLLATRAMVVSSLLTSRYPLLEDLMTEYHQTINGTFSPLWSFTTTGVNLYSVVRGFKHYRCGKPLNVVDNHHLSILLNSGLLLEQSLVFGSIDPLGLIEVVRKTQQALKQNPSQALYVFNTQMREEGYNISTDNLTEGSANVDADSPMNETVETVLPLNLSEIAERILYNITSVTMLFKNSAGDFYEEILTFDEAIQKKINESIQRAVEQSFYLTKVTKQLVVNTTTLHHLEGIVSEVYQDTLGAIILNRSIVSEQWGDPGEGWTNGDIGVWVSVSCIPIMKQPRKPPKGFIVPGCALYDEQYQISYERNHSWWRMENNIINGTILPVKVWKNVSDQLVETVTLQSFLQHYASCQGSCDDVVDVFYLNETIEDLNLEDTLEKYLSLYPDSEPEKQGFITTRENTGSIGLVADVQGSFSDWVLDEAWDSLEDILWSVQEITLRPGVDAMHFPDPVVFMEKAKEDLLAQYNTHIDEYLSLSQYHPDQLFLSVGKKSVYLSRDWYVHFLKNMTESVFSRILDEFTNVTDTAIQHYTDFHRNNITETIEAASEAIRNQFTISFGYPMNLTRLHHHSLFVWNETVRLAVDQYPNYLDPFEKTSWDAEELWSLKIRNRCLFGPTGLPLLPPTPVSPWLMTMNCWIVDVEGEYAQMKIIDTSDETIFNPLLGHEPQTYVRELRIITVSNTTVGENMRLSFGFTTMAFGLVPPWGMMLGDIQENWFDDHTTGFDTGE